MASLERKLAPVALLDPARHTFEDMLRGYAVSMRARGLTQSTIRVHEFGVQRFFRFTGTYPWEWCPQDVEDFTSSLLSRTTPLAHSTIRGYHQIIKSFCKYVSSASYDWGSICLERFGSVPTQICHPWNTFAHLAEFEARPARRPFGYDELEAFFAQADERARHLLEDRRKGALPALRDAQFFKTVYAFGLRRREAVMLDLHDLRSNPYMPAWGNFAKLHVRYGKSMKGAPPRRRTVLACPEFAWAVDGLRYWVEEVRPRLAGDTPALWVSERQSRITTRTVDQRFAEIRSAAGLDPSLTLHSLRHSYVTHLIEFGYAAQFVQEQVGHNHSSTTAIYTSVSDDFKNRMFQDALSRVLGEGAAT